jgi:hypothetical protein
MQAHHLRVMANQLLAATAEGTLTARTFDASMGPVKLTRRSMIINASGNRNQSLMGVSI